MYIIISTFILHVTLDQHIKLTFRDLPASLLVKAGTTGLSVRTVLSVAVSAAVTMSFLTLAAGAC